MQRGQLRGPRQPGCWSSGSSSGPATLTNMQSFFAQTTPIVPLQVNGTSAHDASFSLRDLWDTYEEWSAYGAEVPLQIPRPGGGVQEALQCFVPYISGIQLFWAHPSPGTGTSRDGSSAGGPSPTGLSRQPMRSSPSLSLSTTSDAGSLASCSESLDSEGDGEAELFDRGRLPGGTLSPHNPAKAHAHPHSAVGIKNSVLPSPVPPPQPCFQHFETEAPHLRPPLWLRLAELVRAWELHHESGGEGAAVGGSFRSASLGPALRLAGVHRPWTPPPSPFAPSHYDCSRPTSAPSPPAPQTPTAPPSPPRRCPLLANSRELHPCSWFAVAWYPLPRTPVAHEDVQDSNAAFLTFHSLSLVGGVGGAPLPPLPCAPASAVLSLRTEARRASLTQRAAGALRAGGGGRRGGPGTAPPPPHVTCLRPFAFTPYKVVGALWRDDFNLLRQHLPMLASAPAWLQRRAVRLPDHDFFVAAAQGHRALPSLA